MPIIAGIAFSGWTPGSFACIHLLSSDDPNFSRSSTITLADNLQETVKEIATLFPENPVRIKLALPAYLDNPTRRPFLQAFKQAGLGFPVLSENLQLGLISLVSDDHGPQNEILFHISPTIVIGCLVSTTVEEGTLDWTSLRETTFDSPSSETQAIIAQFVDAAQAALDKQELSEAAGTELKRIVVIDSAIMSTQVTLSDWKVDSEAAAASPIELIKIGFPSIALQAAKSTLAQYKSSLEYSGCEFNEAALRIGIVKADGFVHTVIPRHTAFPKTQSATLTTSKDNQTRATVSVVVGDSPIGNENLCVGQLVLHNLPARPAGELAICVTVDVNLDGGSLVTAEEVDSGVSEKIVIRTFIGVHHSDELEEVLKKFKSRSCGEHAEKEWVVGKDKRGALPE